MCAWLRVLWCDAGGVRRCRCGMYAPWQAYARCSAGCDAFIPKISKPPHSVATQDGAGGPHSGGSYTWGWRDAGECHWAVIPRFTSRLGAALSGLAATSSCPLIER